MRRLLALLMAKVQHVRGACRDIGTSEVRSGCDSLSSPPNRKLHHEVKKVLKVCPSTDEAVKAWSLRRLHDLILHAVNSSRHSVASADREVARHLSPRWPQRARLPA